jgi:hypothetical protein
MVPGPFAVSTTPTKGVPLTSKSGSSAYREALYEMCLLFRDAIPNMLLFEDTIMPSEGEPHIILSSVVGWAISTPLVAAFMIGLRFYTREKIIHALGKDDWLILLSLVSERSLGHLSPETYW